MTERNDTQEARELTPEELASVAGGFGSWDIEREHLLNFHVALGLVKRDEAMRQYGDDAMKARRAWMKDNEPENLRYIIGDDELLTKEDFVEPI